jgi:hypothetical protein
MEMDFPWFDGDDPANWNYKDNLYFAFHETQGMDKIPIASFHMEGEALIWFQDVEYSGLVKTWESFVKACLIRFGCTAYDNPMEALTTLNTNHHYGSLKSPIKGSF